MQSGLLLIVLNYFILYFSSNSSRSKAIIQSYFLFEHSNKNNITKILKYIRLKQKKKLEYGIKLYIFLSFQTFLYLIKKSCDDQQWDEF